MHAMISNTECIIINIEMLKFSQLKSVGDNSLLLHLECGIWPSWKRSDPLPFYTV